MNDKNELK